jgi:tRNA-Thr(GGU) m(6)t(6)A37 methyltransferase TsaA
MEAIQNIVYKPIGIIHSPFTEPAGTPIQAIASQGAEGSVEVFQQYGAGLRDINGFSHLYLVYCFHLARTPSLMVKPFLDDQTRGVFSTRAPNRPNPIGISIVELIGVNDNILHVRDMDILDGTPLLDIKPYLPDFDHRDAKKIGWLQKKIERLSGSRDDGRFRG